MFLFVLFFCSVVCFWIGVFFVVIDISIFLVNLLIDLFCIYFGVSVFILLCNFWDSVGFFRIVLSFFLKVVLLSRLDLRLCNKLCIVSMVWSCGICWVICFGLKFLMLVKCSLMFFFLLLLVSVFGIERLIFGLNFESMLLKLFLLMLIFFFFDKGWFFLIWLKLLMVSSLSGSLIFFCVLLVWRDNLRLMCVLGILFWNVLVIVVFFFKE